MNLTTKQKTSFLEHLKNGEKIRDVPISSLFLAAITKIFPENLDVIFEWFQKKKVFESYYQMDYKRNPEEFSTADFKMPFDVFPNKHEEIYILLESYFLGEYSYVILPFLLQNLISQFPEKAEEILKKVKLTRYHKHYRHCSKGNEKSLFLLARKGDVAAVTKLLKTGVAVDLTDEAGETALSLAADDGHTRLVRILLEFGAAVDFKSKRGTPLLLAASAYGGHTGVVRILLEFGAAVDSKNRKGNTPLTNATMKGNVKVVELLLEYGASISLSETLTKNNDFFKAFKALHHNVDFTKMSYESLMKLSSELLAISTTYPESDEILCQVLDVLFPDLRQLIIDMTSLKDSVVKGLSETADGKSGTAASENAISIFMTLDHIIELIGARTFNLDSSSFERMSNFRYRCSELEMDASISAEPPSEEILQHCNEFKERLYQCLNFSPKFDKRYNIVEAERRWNTKRILDMFSDVETHPCKTKVAAINAADDWSSLFCKNNRVVDILNIETLVHDKDQVTVADPGLNGVISTQ